MEKSLFEQMGGTYHQEGDYMIPDLIAPEAPNIGIWGQHRRKFLKEHRRILYNSMLYSGTLNAHLEDVDKSAIEMFDRLVNQISTPKTLCVAEAPSRANRAVREGSVLFSLVRPYLENIAYIDSALSDCIASTGFYVCNSNGALYPKFMYYLMLSGYVIDGLTQFMKGDNSPSISKENLENWLYPIPPYKEQIIIIKVTQDLLTELQAIEESLS